MSDTHDLTETLATAAARAVQARPGAIEAGVRGCEGSAADSSMGAAPRKRVVGRPFPKGVSGNPGGRARGPKLSTLIAAELEKATVEGSAITKAQVIAARLVNLAEAGDLGAIREILDRLEGKPVARQEQGDPGSFADLSDVDTDTLRKALRRVT